MDSEDYSFFAHNKTIFSKIRRIIIPTNWEEFISSPTLSMIQYGVVACLAIYLSATLIKNDSPSEKALLKENKKNCESNYTNLIFTFDNTNLKYNLLIDKSEKKPQKYNLSDQDKENIKPFVKLKNIKDEVLILKENQEYEQCSNTSKEAVKELTNISNQIAAINKRNFKMF